MQVDKTMRKHIVVNLLYKRVSRLYTKLSLARPTPPEPVMNALYDKCVALQRILWDELESFKRTLWNETEYNRAKVVYDEMQNVMNAYEQLITTTKIHI